MSIYICVIVSYQIALNAKKEGEKRMKSEPNSSSALLASDTSFTFFFPKHQLVYSLLVGFSCWTSYRACVSVGYTVFSVFKSSQQPVRGDCISVLISRNEHPLHQHLFTWHYSFWHAFRYFRFGVQKVHTQLEFQRRCGVSIDFMIRKESNFGEHSAVLAMDASSCSEVPCCAALTAAEKGKWNAAWAKSPVIKNSCSS